jgi:hypothetical protein
MSMTATARPLRAACTANPSAAVVLPVPPFWPTSDIVNIFISEYVVL